MSSIQYPLRAIRGVIRTWSWGEGWCCMKVGVLTPLRGVENPLITCSCSLLWGFCRQLCCQCQLLLQVFMVMCVWSCSPLTVDNTEPHMTNYNDSHCVDIDDIDTHDESDESLIFSTPTLPSSSPSCTDVTDDVSTGLRNICSTVSAVGPRLSSSDLNLVLVLACTFVIFILNYLFFCFVLSLMGLRVIAKFSIELD